MITKGFNKASKEEIYQDLLKRTGLKNDSVIAAYMYGSRVYGNIRDNSDWDFIVILNEKDYVQEQFSDNLINVNFFTAETHQKRIDDHEISALECQFIRQEFILKEIKPFSFKLDLQKLRASISAKSSNSWVKAKKKLTVAESYNDTVGKKSLWHALRIVDFGTQVARSGIIVDYETCNDFYDEVMFCNDWTEMFEKYKEKHNNLLTEFRKYAPK